MIAVRNWTLVAVCLAILSPGLAVGQSEPGALTDAERVIQAVAESPTDAQLKQRLDAIYRQIDMLAGIQVSVSEGVVRLSGAVAKDSQAQRAQDLAIRVAGVVTVVDDIERSLGVEDNLVPLLDGLYDKLTHWLRALPLLLMALALFAMVAYAGHRIASLSGLWRRVAPNPFLAELIAQAFRVAAVALGLVIALDLLGARTLIGTLLGGVGIVTLAIGFAIRDTLENYISSIMLSLRQPFRPNDHVVINDYEGIVVRLTSRATVLMTPDGNQLRIPNATVFKAVILNYSRNPERRFDFELGVDAEDDPLLAMQVGLDAIRTLSFVLATPKPAAYIKTVGDSNIVICFQGWVNQNDADWRKVRSHAIRAAMTVLDERGFTLPEPIYRLRFDAASAATASAPMQRPSKDAKPSATEAPIVQAPMTPEDDVRPDDEIKQLVHEERAMGEATDLLDESSPTE